ncbi:aminotransferase class I/II-fold pyridoxal phosphate-dependent enzyme [Chryseobacterium indologenes]|uniref:aminotransferase class I/II-fold pyridoxal phosphate-dependent enzyme n=1 Tax=Chryseobacterium indologenes TaxID=253 RepID=UPI0010246B9A|nr:aminotransferase class I/II-fold pyridoxal phosphate-dependent enzyme [Chryseobacterium indologenes]VFA40680.1 LL-diaminopimelate aminotransferase [Chryseobacterium indologenes]
MQKIEKQINSTEECHQKDAFAILDTLTRAYEEQIKEGASRHSIINLSIGNPDLTPNILWIKKLSEHIQNPELHGYAKFNTEINDTLKNKFATYHKRRFSKSQENPSLDYKEEVLDILGSKEGIFYSLFSILQSGDKILIPDPSYPVYNSVAELLGAEVVKINLKSNGNPDLDNITREDAVAAKVLVLCSPGNPTTHVVTEDCLREVIAFCKRYEILLIQDLAYVQIAFDDNDLPPSVLAIEGGKEVAIELHSLSKSCSLAGWRIGFIAGNKTIIEKIAKIKSSIDFGLFLPLQMVTIEILDQLELESNLQKAVYEERLEFWISSMAEIGWLIPKPKAGFFLWTKLPDTFLKKDDDIAFVEQLFKDTGVLITPGSGFGKAGAGYVRIALVQDLSQLKIASCRIKSWLSKEGS